MKWETRSFQRVRIWEGGFRSLKREMIRCERFIWGERNTWMGPSVQKLLHWVIATTVCHFKIQIYCGEVIYFQNIRLNDHSCLIVPKGSKLISPLPLFHMVVGWEIEEDRIITIVLVRKGRLGVRELENNDFKNLFFLWTFQGKGISFIISA